MSEDRGHVRGERLNDGLSAVAVGEGPPPVVLPGLGQGADLSVRVPRMAALSTAALARGLKRTVHLIHRPLRPAQAPGEAALVAAAQTWDVTGRLGELGVPVLVVGGTRDRLVPPDLVRATASGIPDARLVLHPGRGHATALFDPRSKPAIAAFLAEPAR